LSISIMQKSDQNDKSNKNNVGNRCLDLKKQD
jgi:hypothetical protein